MDLGQINVLDVVGIISILDLTACPVDAFDLDYFAVGDFAGGRDCALRQ